MGQGHLSESMRTELEAAAFRRLLSHLRQHTEVQNIELMILADFCRNCLANWYRDAGEERGIEMSVAEAREHVYGVSYDDWKAKYQKEATPEQQAAFDARRKAKAAKGQ